MFYIVNGLDIDLSILTKKQPVRSAAVYRERVSGFVSGKRESPPLSGPWPGVFGWGCVDYNK